MTSPRLYLSSFEHLMVAQDSPAYPCVVYCKLQFRGKLDREAFQCALSRMLDRHPLLRSRVRRTWRGTHWVEETSDRVPIRWLTMSTPEEWVADSRLDLFHEVGTKVYVYDQPDACSVIFQCHHACVDGLGLQTALDDLWQLYDARIRGTERQLPGYDPALLPVRNRFGLSFPKALAAIPKQAVGLLGVRQYLMRDPVPILPHEPISDASPPPLPANCHTVRLEQAVARELRRAASNQHATLNELVTCSVFEAVAAFRQRRGIQNREEWIRMMVPVNMRTTAQDQRQTACNIVSSVFLDRTPRQIADRQGLLASIHQEMELIKQNRLGLIFIASLWVKKQLPAWRTPQPAPGRCQTTVVVTNVGKAFASSPLRSTEGHVHTGSLKLENITMLAPMTPFLSAALTISEYAGDVSLALRYDSRILASEDARQLLDWVVAALKTWMGNPLDSLEVSAP